MADLLQTTLKVKGATDVVLNLLDDNETFVYQPDGNQVMIIHNVTGSAISPLLMGDAASAAFKVQGIGTIDLTGGYAVGSIEAGEAVTIPLESVRHWIAGISSIVNAAGATCIITTNDNLPNYEYIWLQGGRLVADGRLTATSRLWG